MKGMGTSLMTESARIGPRSTVLPLILPVTPPAAGSAAVWLKLSRPARLSHANTRPLTTSTATMNGRPSATYSFTLRHSPRE